MSVDLLIAGTCAFPGEAESRQPDHEQSPSARPGHAGDIDRHARAIADVRQVRGAEHERILPDVTKVRRVGDVRSGYAAEATECRGGVDEVRGRPAGCVQGDGDGLI